MVSTLDITLRVGCNLVYEAAGPATLLLNLRLCRDPHLDVVFEALALGEGLPSEEFTDSHGNQVLRIGLAPGTNCFKHDAIVAVSSLPDNRGTRFGAAQAPGSLPPDLLRYTLPSRYCDSDKLNDFAWERFGRIEHGRARIEAISRWIHENIEYRHESGRSDLSAWDVLQRGYGVCRDFAHISVALNRCFNLPARYVSGYLPDVGVAETHDAMDFHAYSEVYLGDAWYTSDPRFHVPRIGRVRVACGQDAVDGAFSTIYGAAILTDFQVWTYQVERGAVGVGDPIDLSRRLDNQWTIKRDPAV